MSAAALYVSFHHSVRLTSQVILLEQELSAVVKLPLKV